MRAGSARQFGLFLGRNRGDHTRADIVRHLHQEKPHASGRGMNQRRFALLQRISIMR